MTGIKQLLRLQILYALQEDLGTGDVTTGALIPPLVKARAAIIAKAPGVLAGSHVASLTFRLLDRRIRVRVLRRDGQRVRPGDALIRLEGPAASILKAERTALNFLGHLSGIATLTRRYVDGARPYRAILLDTRKTLPGLRLLEKYAVRMGGGQNHRIGLSDAVLIKTNHLIVLQRGEGVIRNAVVRARRARSKQFIEVEVGNLREFREALHARPDAILLDNWSIAQIRRAVALRDGLAKTRHHSSPITHHLSPLLEVSGGVTLQNVRAIAKTGVDRISIGRLTHSAPTLDLSLRIL